MKKIILLLGILFGLVLISGFVYGAECHQLNPTTDCNSLQIDKIANPLYFCELYCDSGVACEQDHEDDNYRYCKDSTDTCDTPCGTGEGEGEVPEFSSAFAVIVFIIIAFAVFWFIKKRKK
jgi:hypothetical protein